VRHHNRRWPRLAIATAAASLLLLSACSDGSGGREVPGPHFILKDFEIDSSQQIVSSGNVVFHIYNESPSTHEFVLVKTDIAPDNLPVAPDGLSINEEHLDDVGEISEVETQTSRTLSLNLAPGQYVFFCNLEGHFLGGMHGVLEVLPP
jgi:uncharacterized cupredoxin-like copper-binding protein